MSSQLLSDSQNKRYRSNVLHYVSLANFLSCKLSWKACPFAAWKHASSFAFDCTDNALAMSKWQSVRAQLLT